MLFLPTQSRQDPFFLTEKPLTRFVFSRESKFLFLIPSSTIFALIPYGFFLLMPRRVCPDNAFNFAQAVAISRNHFNLFATTYIT